MNVNVYVYLREKKRLAGLQAELGYIWKRLSGGGKDWGGVKEGTQKGRLSDHELFEKINSHSPESPERGGSQ